MSDLSVVELTDKVLQKVLANPAFRREFPFLATANAQQKTSEGCGGCPHRRRRRKQSAPDFNTLRRSVANLPTEKLVKFRAMLKAKQVVVRYQKPSGEPVKKKF